MESHLDDWSGVTDCATPHRSCSSGLLLLPALMILMKYSAQLPGLGLTPQYTAVRFLIMAVLLQRRTH